MSRESTCRCLICDLERALTVEVADPSFAERYRACAASRGLLRTFPCALDLLDFLHTRGTEAGIPFTDPVLAALVDVARTNGNGTCLRDLLVLAFVPTLHSTSRQVARRYPTLAPEDVAQHTVTSLLEIFETYSMSRSHIAFAVSRLLRRKTFEWAARQTRLAPSAVDIASTTEDIEDSVERITILRHFLHRCRARGLLTAKELQLLVDFKLNAERDRSGPVSIYSNASRQRMKRLVNKLRRIAHKPASPNCNGRVCGAFTKVRTSRVDASSYTNPINRT